MDYAFTAPTRQLNLSFLRLRYSQFPQFPTLYLRKFKRSQQPQHDVNVMIMGSVSSIMTVGLAGTLNIYLPMSADIDR